MGSWSAFCWLCLEVSCCRCSSNAKLISSGLVMVGAHVAATEPWSLGVHASMEAQPRSSSASKMVLARRQNMSNYHSRAHRSLEEFNGARRLGTGRRSPRIKTQKEPPQIVPDHKVPMHLPLSQQQRKRAKAKQWASPSGNISSTRFLAHHFRTSSRALGERVFVCKSESFKAVPLERPGPDTSLGVGTLPRHERAVRVINGRISMT
ncbi:hypothetical protein B0T13DRAFT_445500 [Neurospora crassa]|nr:hypothetical protein B0T13DRAFT_445500 [Neurospora crassa]